MTSRWSTLKFCHPSRCDVLDSRGLEDHRRGDDRRDGRRHVPIPDLGPLCESAGVAPASHASAGKLHPVGTRQGSTWAACTSRSSQRGVAHQGHLLARRRRSNKATIAAAHTISDVSLHLLTNGALYDDPGARFFELRQDPAVEARRLQGLLALSLSRQRSIPCISYVRRHEDAWKRVTRPGAPYPVAQLNYLSDLVTTRPLPLPITSADFDPGRHLMSRLSRCDHLIDAKFSLSSGDRRGCDCGRKPHKDIPSPIVWGDQAEFSGGTRPPHCSMDHGTASFDRCSEEGVEPARDDERHIVQPEQGVTPKGGRRLRYHHARHHRSDDVKGSGVTQSVVANPRHRGERGDRRVRAQAASWWPGALVKDRLRDWRRSLSG
jgi:hypothetical protein